MLRAQECPEFRHWCSATSGILSCSSREKAHLDTITNKPAPQRGPKGDVAPLGLEYLRLGRDSIKMPALRASDLRHARAVPGPGGRNIYSFLTLPTGGVAALNPRYLMASLQDAPSPESRGTTGYGNRLTRIAEIVESRMFECAQDIEHEGVRSDESTNQARWRSKSDGTTCRQRGAVVGGREGCRVDQSVAGLRPRGRWTVGTILCRQETWGSGKSRDKNPGNSGVAMRFRST